MMLGIGRLNHAYAAAAAGSGSCSSSVSGSGSGRGVLSLLFPSKIFINNNKRKTTNISCFCTLNTTEPPHIRSPSLVALEYAELDLKDKISEKGHVRLRQHVNPLSASLTVPVKIPNWKHVFRDPTLPLMVDIGCGFQVVAGSSFGLQKDPRKQTIIWEWKYGIKYGHLLLPVEISISVFEIESPYCQLLWDSLVDRAQHWVKELALGNIHFMFANAMVSFDELVSTYPGPLTFVSILCPDPHFKKKHHKRRVVQKELVDSILKNLSPGGQVFLQSDVFEVALDMRRQFESAAYSDELQHIDAVDPEGIVCDADGWLLNNPMGIRTEREIHAEFEGARIYRIMYQKRLVHEKTGPFLISLL